MKKYLIGQLIRTIRKDRGIKQRDLARTLGVCHQVVSDWERGVRPFPARHVPSAAALLGVTPEQFELEAPPDKRESAERGIRTLYRLVRTQRHRYRPAFPIGARVEHLTTLGPRQQALHDRVKDTLPQCEYKEVVERFPRDSRWELQLVFHMLGAGARVVYTSYSRYRLPLNTLHDCDWTDGQDLLQPALLWERGDERIVVFGQAWLNVPWHPPVRPDFLVWYKRQGHPGYWLYIEIDDTSHREKQYQDEARALAIALPGLRYENYTTSDVGFFQRVLRDIRDLRDKARKMRRTKRRKARELETERQAQAASKLNVG